MLSAVAGQDLTFSFNVEIDAQLSDTASARMRVSGPAGLLADWTDVPFAGTPELFTVTVPAALNALTPGAAREVRLVEIDVDGGQTVGLTRFSQEYVLVVD